MIGVETRYYMDIRVDNLSLDTALERLELLMEESKNDGVPRQVFFTNVHSIHLARKDVEFRQLLDQADLVLPDGIGLKIAGKILDMPITENLNGTDFIPKVCRLAEVGQWSVYLLGAREEIIKRSCQNLKLRFPHLKIAGYRNGYFSGDEEQKVLDEITRLKPDILLVALGSPLQEKWIARNADSLNVRACFAVGGLFDFLSNDKKRAPVWMREMGFEWLYRFLQAPQNKWERIFVEIPIFLSMILLRKAAFLSPRLYSNQLKWMFNGQRDKYISS